MLKVSSSEFQCISNALFFSFFNFFFLLSFFVFCQAKTIWDYCASLKSILFHCVRVWKKSTLYCYFLHWSDLISKDIKTTLKVMDLTELRVTVWHLVIDWVKVASMINTATALKFPMLQQCLVWTGVYWRNSQFYVFASFSRFLTIIIII